MSPALEGLLWGLVMGVLVFALGFAVGWMGQAYRMWRRNRNLEPPF